MIHKTLRHHLTHASPSVRVQREPIMAAAMKSAVIVVACLLATASLRIHAFVHIFTAGTTGLEANPTGAFKAALRVTAMVRAAAVVVRTFVDI